MSAGCRSGLLLLLLGGLMGCLDAFLLIIFRLLVRLRQLVYEAPSAYAGSYALYVISAAVLAAAAHAWTVLLHPGSVGSGLPKMRAVLLEHGHEPAPPRGIARLGAYLGLRMLLAKAGGLLFALASGLRVGREGPFVHMSSIAAVQVLRVPYFANRGGFSSNWTEFIFAAAAAVIGALYDAPVGGLLYTIEVLTTFSLRVSVYVKCFVTALVGAIVAWAFREGDPLYTPDAEIEGYFWSRVETLVASFVLGAVSGLLGGAFVRVTVLAGRFYKWLMRRSGMPLTVGFGLVVALAVVTALATYPLGQYMRDPFLKSLQCLLDATLNRGVLVAPASSGECSGPHGAGQYAIYFGLNFPLTALSSALPVPAGVFIPVFSSGAALGRLYQSLLQAMGVDTNTEPATYGLIGAAAVAVGVTRSVSVAIIAMEMVAVNTPQLPILMAVLVSLFVGDLVSSSVYDALAKEARLSFLPILRLNWAGKHWRGNRVGELVARQPFNGGKVVVNDGDLVDGEQTSSTALDEGGRLPYVTVRTSCEELERLMAVASTEAYTARSGAARLIPVVSDDHERYLLGGITCARVRRVVEAYRSFVSAPDEPAPRPVSHAMRRRHGLASHDPTPGSMLLTPAAPLAPAARLLSATPPPSPSARGDEDDDAKSSIGGGADSPATPASPASIGRWRSAFAKASVAARKASEASSAANGDSDSSIKRIDIAVKRVARSASSKFDNLVALVAEAAKRQLGGGGVEDDAGLRRISSADRRLFARVREEVSCMDDASKQELVMICAEIVPATGGLARFFRRMGPQSTTDGLPRRHSAPSTPVGCVGSVDADSLLARLPTTPRATGDLEGASLSEGDGGNYEQFFDASDAPGGDGAAAAPCPEASVVALDAPLDLMELDSLLHILDHAPAQLEEQTLLSDAFLIFSSHTVRAEAFVTRRGRLVSALSRPELYHATYRLRARLQQEAGRGSGNREEDRGSSGSARKGALPRYRWRA